MRVQPWISNEKRKRKRSRTHMCLPLESTDPAMATRSHVLNLGSGRDNHGGGVGDVGTSGERAATHHLRAVRPRTATSRHTPLPLLGSRRHAWSQKRDKRGVEPAARWRGLREARLHGRTGGERERGRVAEGERWAFELGFLRSLHI